MLWDVLIWVEVAWVAFIAVWMVLQRRSPTATLAWIFGLALLPLVGMPVYVLLGPRRLYRKHIRRAVAREAVGRWTAEQGWEEVPTPVPSDPRHRRLVEVGTRCGEAPLTATREARLFLEGDECFEALLEAVEGAEHHVHLEYYIYEPGALERRLSGALAEKAREGVEVRLLMDGFGSNGMKPRHRRPLVDAGVEVEFFNSMRFARFKPRLANFRTHRKIAVVDGRTAFTGGMNISDDHSRAVRGDRAWRDCHLRLRGAAALPLQLMFLEDWHYATGSAPLDPEYLPRPDDPPGGVLAHVLGSGPDDESFAIHRTFFAAIGQARERILATTPYLVPDEAILAALTGAALRGVDVRLLVPKRTDTVLVGAASRSYFAELTAAGVRIFEYLPTLLHAKTMVIDDDVSIVGSANLDNRSFRLNFEVAAVLYDAGIAGTLAERFARDLERAEEVVSYPESDLPFRRRLVEGVARLFSPLL